VAGLAVTGSAVWAMSLDRYMSRVRTDFPPADVKLRELIVYLSALSEGDKFWGAIKLNKLLFYCDFMAYLRFGQSITSQEYQALEQGPAPRRLKPVLEKMKKAGDIIERENFFHGFKQLQTVARRTAATETFSGPEVDLIHETIQRFWQMSATEISERSHTFLGWKLAQIGETIPYKTVLIGTRKATEKERRLARRFQKLAGESLKKGAK